MQTTNLWKITNIKTWKLDANAKIEGWVYPFFTCSKEISWIDVPSYDCECVLIAGNGDLNVKYYKGKFDAYQRTYIIESNWIADLDIKYLYYFMDQYMETLRSQTIGGVIQYIKMNNLTDIEIPLPPLATQRAIADKLEKLQSLIDLKKQAITKTDELTKAIFLEMFGDPTTNPNEWEEKKFETFGKVKGGATIKSEEFVEEWIPVIRIWTANKWYIDISNAVYLSNEVAEKYKRYFIYPWDLVITLTWTVGKEDYWNICIVDSLFEKYVLNQRVAKLEIDSNIINPIFLSFYLKRPEVKSKLTWVSRWVRQANISNPDIEKLDVILPPLPLQQKFADIITQIEAQKSEHKLAIAKLEELYQATMQESFKI